MTTMTLEQTQKEILDKRIISLITDIYNNPATIKNAQFTHSTFCQLGLPRSKVDTDCFSRECDNKIILLTSGELWDGERFIKQVIPYGTFPRIALAWINSYSVIHKTRVIDIGKSPGAFLKKLGLHVSGGPTGTIQNCIKQMRALAACTIILKSTGESNGEQISLWKEKNNQLWPKQIILSEEYFNSLKQ